MTLVLFKNQDQDDFLFFHDGFQLITFNQPHPLPLKIKGLLFIKIKKKLPHPHPLTKVLFTTTL